MPPDALIAACDYLLCTATAPRRAAGGGHPRRRERPPSGRPHADVSTRTRRACRTSRPPAQRRLLGLFRPGLRRGSGLGGRRVRNRRAREALRGPQRFQTPLLDDQHGSQAGFFSGWPRSPATPSEERQMTRVSISGTQFHIDAARPTPGARSRATVEGSCSTCARCRPRSTTPTFETRRHWAYRHRRVGPERNTDAPRCRAGRRTGAGLTINVQGGGPVYVPGSGAPTTTALPRGELADYARRIARPCRRPGHGGDRRVLYWVWSSACAGRGLSAARRTTRWTAGRHGAPEPPHRGRERGGRCTTAGMEISARRVHEMVRSLKEAHPEMLISTSGGSAEVSTAGMPSGDPSPVIIPLHQISLRRRPSRRPSARCASTLSTWAPGPVLINRTPREPNLRPTMPRGATTTRGSRGRPTTPTSTMPPPALGDQASRN